MVAKPTQHTEIFAHATGSGGLRHSRCAVLRRLAAGVGLAAAVLVFLLAAPAARAQNLIRDAELEHSLAQLARPVLQAAGLSPSRIKIIVLNDRRLNAFIIDTRHIFINSGLIARMGNAAMLQSVIAHEAAHIANGHISRRLANMRSSRTAAGFGAALAAVVAASGNGQAAGGLLLGTGSTAQRLLFAHTRAEESSADRSAARYLRRAGINTTAMVDVLEIFRGQEALSAGRQDPYFSTHPLNADRLRQARAEAAAAANTGGQPSRDDAYWYARLRAKLGAFIGNPGQTLRRLRHLRGNDVTEIVLLQRAIAYHRRPDIDKALENVNALLARRPQDPYYHELKGQILLESRRFGPAARSYGRAAALLPENALILAGWGRALLAVDTTATIGQARQVLERAYARDPNQPRMLRDLALAWAKTGNNGMASLVTAERYALNGRFDTAKIHATRATGLLARGSQGHRRAEDIIRAAEAAGAEN